VILQWLRGGLELWALVGECLGVVSSPPQQLVVPVLAAWFPLVTLHEALVCVRQRPGLRVQCTRPRHATPLATCQDMSPQRPAKWCTSTQLTQQQPQQQSTQQQTNAAADQSTAETLVAMAGGCDKECGRRWRLSTARLGMARPCYLTCTEHLHCLYAGVAKRKEDCGQQCTPALHINASRSVGDCLVWVLPNPQLGCFCSISLNSVCVSHFARGIEGVWGKDLT
jgi:hypothetical protein